MLSNKFKVNYSIGAVANGVKTDTFTFFLLFFYSNIIGLNPGLAGSAIFIALCVDAVSVIHLWEQFQTEQIHH